jgi:hypothetical protein
MSGRALRAAGVASVALALLSGCTLGGHPHGAATTPALAPSAPPPVGSIEHPRPVECVDGTTYRPGQSGSPDSPGPGNPSAHGNRGDPSAKPSSPTSSSASLSPTPSAPSASHQSPSHPSRAHPSGTASPSAGAAKKDDVTVGPLTWQDLRGLADGDQRGRGIDNSGGWHYRISSLVGPGAVVTVTIGAQQRARAGLEFGGEYGIAPAPAVTFHGCPGGPTSFLGAFFVAGDGRACVPLDIRVGDGPTRHVVISFFNGRCPA